MRSTAAAATAPRRHHRRHHHHHGGDDDEDVAPPPTTFAFGSWHVDPPHADANTDTDAASCSSSLSAFGRRFGARTRTRRADACRESDRTIRFVPDDAFQRPVPTLSLRSGRFLVVVGAGVGVLALLLSGLSLGVPLEDSVGDARGSTRAADAQVQQYQALSGFVWAAVGLSVEKYCAIFLPVMSTYFANRPWHRPLRRLPSAIGRDRNNTNSDGDHDDDDDLGLMTWAATLAATTAERPPTRLQRSLLCWFAPVVLYVIHVGFSSVFIEHRVVSLDRGLVDSDFIGGTRATTLNSLSFRSSNNSSGDGDGLDDSILRSAMRRRVVPFAIDPRSPCASTSLRNATTNSTGSRVDLPSPAAIKATSVVFGFAPRAWHTDALPKNVARVPSRAIELDFGDNISADDDLRRDDRLREFMAEAQTLDEDALVGLFVQGFALFDQAVSASTPWSQYPCTTVDHREDHHVLNVTSPEAIDNSPDHRRGLQAETEGGRGPTLTAETTDEGFEVIASGDRKWKAYAGLRKCYGRGSSLPAIGAALKKHRQSKPNRHLEPTLSQLIRALAGSTGSSRELSDPTPLKGLAVNETRVRIETIALSRDVNLTAVTLDVPFAPDAAYRRLDDQRPHGCDGHGRFRDPEAARQYFATDAAFAQAQREACDSSYVAYDEPKTACGATTCIFRDESTIGQLQKQILVVPFMRHCDPANITYDHELRAWFPSGCDRVPQSAFVYGLGSYVEAARLERRVYAGPVLHGARRHYVLTFMKFDWRLQRLDERLNARCEVDGGCEGLLFPLTSEEIDKSSRAEPTMRVLISGKANVPSGLTTATLRDPIPLVSLHAPKFFSNHSETSSDDGHRFYTWERLNLSRLHGTTTKSTNSNATTTITRRVVTTKGLNLRGEQCSMLVDAYLRQVEENHYYIEKPVTSMYASMLFYLFENAVVKSLELESPAGNRQMTPTVDLSARVIGRVRMSGDLELKEIRYSIPPVSAAATALGVLALVLWLAVVLRWPRDAVRLTDATDFPTRYAEVLTDDAYSAGLHARVLRLPTGAYVRMDDYCVAGMCLRHIDHPEERLTL